MDSQKHTYLEFLFSRINNSAHFLSCACRDHLNSIAFVEHWPKNQFLQMRGHTVKNVWFVVDGCLRTCYFNEKKTDYVTQWFWFPGNWAGVFSHLFSAAKSDRVIEAIEDSNVLSFSFDDLVATRLQYPREWQMITASMIEVYIRDFDMLHNDLVTLSARERYRKLLCSHPEVFQMINQKDIASYLNISREELSRLRAEKQ
ncbi:Crp/Fnr family transcriptional regulator [Chitinophaga sp. CC14]|uniref:Crp/Fnr family transcriptional regulator n=1 Tax=Chitinophaga sp. CC14 TaxID=3029199 RepID=UPI003B7ECE1B